MNSPAFLFYSKDWIADTADWEPEAKGVYIDLLAHQHVNGSLPSDMTKLARVARLSPDEFSRIWEDIKHKFDHVDGHVVNHRLNQVVNENHTKALKNKINGCFAAKIKMLNISAKHLLEIKKSFDFEMFTHTPEDEIKDNVYQWVDQMVNQVVHQADNNLLSASASAIVINKNPLTPSKGIAKTDDLNFIDPEYRDIVEDWLAFKSEKKQAYKGPKSIETFLKKLKELSGNHPDTAKKIIQTSMANNWSGIFELKNPKNGNTTNEPKSFSPKLQAI